MTDSNLSDLDPVFQPIATQIMEEGNAAIAPSKARIIITWRRTSKPPRRMGHHWQRRDSRLTIVAKPMARRPRGPSISLCSMRTAAI